MALINNKIYNIIIWQLFVLPYINLFLFVNGSYFQLITESCIWIIYIPCSSYILFIFGGDSFLGSVILGISFVNSILLLQVSKAW